MDKESKSIFFDYGFDVDKFLNDINKAESLCKQWLYEYEDVLDYIEEVEPDRIENIHDIIARYLYRAMSDLQTVEGAFILKNNFN